MLPQYFTNKIAYKNFVDSRLALDLPTFLRMFQMRKGQIMWLLGAGASRAAGIKTASDMVWEFKHKLYCSERKQPLAAIADLGDPVVRSKLQSHFDDQKIHPALNAPDEYSHYFERTYPSAMDRRAYIEAQIQQGKPSFGHHALALLLKYGLSRFFWTTNFDRTVEDAAFHALGGTGKLVVADLGKPQVLAQAVSQQRFPIYAKLHGDFQSEDIKNTSAELIKQDSEMRAAFTRACATNGLAIVGYSGRDTSVMDALGDALNAEHPFPSGLFWFTRFNEEPYSAVVAFMEAARAKDVPAHFIQVETFDELMSDIVRFIPETEPEAAKIADPTKPRLSHVAIRAPGGGFPVIRTNAIPVLSFPAMVRLVKCEIGGWQEIEKAISTAKTDIEAQRTKAGVICFGRDVDIRRTFEPYKIEGTDTVAIFDNQLKRPSGARNLVQNALMRAVGKRSGLVLNVHKGKYQLTTDQTVPASTFTLGDGTPLGSLNGKLAGEIEWAEVCRIRLDYRLDRLWLLCEPRIQLVIPETATAEHVEAAREFRRERRATRRNKDVNAILDGWVKLIAGPTDTIRIKAFNIGDGIDAEFELSRVTGFSGRSA
jgi:hypothetical protein